MEQIKTKQRSLSECKLKVHQLQLQLEQHQQDYTKLLKQKQDYFYENLTWITVLGAAILIYWLLHYTASTLPTGNMLIPFYTGMELVSVFLLARVIYLSRHFIGMKDYKCGHFRTFKDLIEEELLMKQNAEKLLARAEEELAEKQAEADAAASEEDTQPEEEPMILRWDQQDAPADSTSNDLSDTARLIREALETDK